jgi:hypothetical protein
VRSNEYYCWEPPSMKLNVSRAANGPRGQRMAFEERCVPTRAAPCNPGKAGSLGGSLCIPSTKPLQRVAPDNLPHLYHALERGVQ